MVDADNRIITTLSVSDLKALEPGHVFKSLSESVVRFIKEANKRRQELPKSQLTCRLGDRLYSVMERMLDEKVLAIFLFSFFL